jgi:DNA-directed RNA polymerase subunit RPC12/RpoP
MRVAGLAVFVVCLFILVATVFVAGVVGLIHLISSMTAVRCPRCNGRDCWFKVREKMVGVRRIKKVHTFRSGYSGGGYGGSYYDCEGHYHSGYVSVSGTSWHQQQVDALRYDIDVYYRCSSCNHEEVQRVQRDSLEFEV